MESPARKTRTKHANMLFNEFVWNVERFRHFTWYDCLIEVRVPVVGNTSSTGSEDTIHSVDALAFGMLAVISRDETDPTCLCATNIEVLVLMQPIYSIMVQEETK